MVGLLRAFLVVSRSGFGSRRQRLVALTRSNELSLWAELVTTTSLAIIKRPLSQMSIKPLPIRGDGCPSWTLLQQSSLADITPEKRDGPTLFLLAVESRSHWLGPIVAPKGE